MNAFSFLDGTVVVSYAIIGTHEWTAEAWEPDFGGSAHSSLISIEGRWYGKVTSRMLPADLDAMTPLSPERYEAVRLWHADMERLARGYVLCALPGFEVRFIEADAYWEDTP